MSYTLKKLIKRLVALLLVAGIAVGFLLWKNSGVSDYSDKYQGADLSADVGDISRENTYSDYLSAHADGDCPDAEIAVDLVNPIEAEGIGLCSYQGQDNVLMTDEKSSVTYAVTVEQAGWYCLSFDYCTVASRGIDAERCIRINGEVPFRGADTQSFCRNWTDEPTEIGKTDNQGNEIRPTQIEVCQWQTKYAEDSNSGYETEPYRFWFAQGENTLTLEASTEPLVFRSIRLVPVPTTADYAAYAAAQPGSDLAAWSGIVQGEEAQLRSSQSLYATYDHSSPNTTPYSIGTSVLNMIGGTSWTTNGQWIEWQIDIPEDGIYNIAIKGRQNYTRGQSASRKLLIDGKVPFAEVSELRFQYDNDWQMKTLGDENGDYGFYLTKGTHSIRLQVTLGEIGSTVGKMEDSIYRLNQMYRKLLVIMGRTPDKYRDYHVYATYPELAEAMLLESKRLYEIADEVIAVNGGKSSMTGTITVLADLLEDFSDKEDLIKRRLQTFRDDITALGTTMTTLTESQLDIDYIVVKTPTAEWPTDTANITAKIAHETKLFGSSFITDYDTLGNVYDDDEMTTIEVWILTGRDQANILKTIIDDSFTPQSGIGVNVKLVESGTVLSAVAAGIGPDIVLSAGQGEPVNYALRNAAEDLTQFEGWEDVLTRFTESAYTPFLYQDGLYALPEAQYFNVLYYRTDILEELGLSVPETWEDLMNMLPILQNANMEIGLPDIMNKTAPNLSGFYSMMYQNGCSLYTDDGRQALLDAEGAIEAFEDYCKFYTNYDTPKDYSFVDRFRSGEMPIGLADYTTQNTLTVFAPELKGLWDFSLIPGTVQADGTVDHSTQSNCTASMMLTGGTEETKQAAWEFLCWWTSTETQVRFGTEMECLMGASARYATANVEACQLLSWSSEQLEVLNEQRAWTKGNLEVAGGYYTSRHIVNAVRKVVNDDAIPRETLLDYNKTINDEIIKKRAEFNLD